MPETDQNTLFTPTGRIVNYVTIKYINHAALSLFPRREHENNLER